MSPEAIAWLNKFAHRPLNDHQRLALVYLRNNERITNSDYQRLNHVDSVTANRELRGLVQLELIELNSTRRWAYYTLKIPSEVKIPQITQTEEEKILAYIKEKGSINNTECRVLLGVGSSLAWYLLKKMYAQDLLKRSGEKRWLRYYLP